MIHLIPILMLGEMAGESDGSVVSIPLEFLWAIGAVFLAVFFLVRTLRKVRRSKLKDQRSVSQRVDQLRPRLNPIQAQINELMAELADLSRQINGQIDTRIAKLTILRDEAERTIERLEGLLGPSESSSTSDLGSGSDAMFRRDITHKQNVTNRGGADGLSDKRENWSNRPKNYIATDQQARSVLDLAQQGKSALEIAQELDRPVGEVELILALNKK